MTQSAIAARSCRWPTGRGERNDSDGELEHRNQLSVVERADHDCPLMLIHGAADNEDLPTPR
jgi:hypothetical protein